MNRTLIAALIALAGLLPACKDRPRTSKPAPAPATVPRLAGISTDVVKMLVLRRTMEEGEKIEETDLDVKEVETHIMESIGSNVISRVAPKELEGEELSQRVPRGRFLRWDDILGHGQQSPTVLLDEGTESFQIQISPSESPGQMLRVGDRIVLLGVLAPPGKKISTYRIIEGVKVVSIGSMATTPTEGSRPGARRYGSVMKSYRTIGIQVTPETATDLNNVLTHLLRDLRVDVLAHKDKKKFVGKKILVIEELRGLPASGEKPSVIP